MKNRLLLSALICAGSMTAWSSAPALAATNGGVVTAPARVSKSHQLGINTATGSFTATNAGKTWAATWQSTLATPQITLDCGVNNMNIQTATDSLLQCYAGSSKTSTYRLSIADGWVITGYSFKVKATDAAKTLTFTYGSESFTTSDEVKEINVTGLSVDQVDAFTIADNNYGVDITDFTVTYERKGAGELFINMSTGSFTATNGGGTWASNWQSTQEKPQFNLNCGPNNMSVANSNDDRLQCFMGGNSVTECNYNLSIQEGWKIIGYSFDATPVNASNVLTVTDYKGNTYTTGAVTDTIRVNVDSIEVSDLAAFNLKGGNYGIDVYHFKVVYAPDTTGTAVDYRTFKVFDNSGSIPYRIPAIGTAQNGNLVAVADYRHTKADIGGGRLDLHVRISPDNGKTWNDVMKPTVMEGDGQISSWRHDKAAYGDPCIVGDRESGRMMITSCSGFPGFFDSSDNHQGWARWYSDDNGETWGEPTYLDDEFVYKPLAAAGHPVQGFFVGSGKIHQSRYIKKDKYYRLYCAGSTQQNGGNTENWVLYSDDFGETWQFLGGCKVPPIPSGADEPKVEELPDGRILISSRNVSGRRYNIFTFSTDDGMSGSWGTYALSSSAVNGLEANNGCNGEVQILPVIRKSDDTKTFLLLQSLPTSGRTNVSIFYKDLEGLTEGATPTDIAKDWNGRFKVSNTTSAYSTWSWQHDKALAFLYEENSSNGGYDITYKRIDIPTLTSGAYDFDSTYVYTDKQIDFEKAARNVTMAALIDSVTAGVGANTTYIVGDGLLTSDSQLYCPFGHKVMGGTGSDATDIGTLIDGDATTYFHTYWGGGDVQNGTHFLEVSMPEGQTFEGDILGKVIRRSGASADHITEFTISGTNDKTAYDTIAVVTVPNASAGEIGEFLFTIPEGQAWSTLRFNVTGTTNNRGYWHMAEFQLYPRTFDETCFNAVNPDAYKAIAEAITTAEGVLPNTSASDIAALEAAYDAYLKAYIQSGIGHATADTAAPSAIYDLQGRKVAKAAKGVYIINGKKIIK